MIPMDSFEKWSPRLDACAKQFLSAGELEQFNRITPSERQMQLKAMLEKPISNFTMVNEAWFRAKWADTLRLLHPGNSIKILEIATGDADMIPQAVARSHPGSTYVTANMNKSLNASLLEKTAGLNVKLELIDDDASNIESHTGRDRFDVIAFQHGVNDVVQAILCGRAGIDTVNADWMELLPQMISLVQREVADGTLEEHVKAPFMALMNSLIAVLKTGGTIAINHYMFQLDLDWGYPPELFAGFVPLVRKWLSNLDNIVEVPLVGYEPNWWFFLQKLD